MSHLFVVIDDYGHEGTVLRGVFASEETARKAMNASSSAAVLKVPVGERIHDWEEYVVVQPADWTPR